MAFNSESRLSNFNTLLAQMSLAFSSLLKYYVANAGGGTQASYFA